MCGYTLLFAELFLLFMTLSFEEYKDIYLRSKILSVWLTHWPGRHILCLVLMAQFNDIYLLITTDA